MMRNLTSGVLAATITLGLLCGCSPIEEKGTLTQARKGFTTHLTKQERDGTPAPTPPAGVLNTVHYPSPAGSMVAYLSRIPQDNQKHPAIIWIFGGFGNSIGETAWEEATPDNDQSARAFRGAGIVTMYPSFRGGNDNPGVQEGFYGEVEDVIAAAEFLAQQKGIDPTRIYLGGHSTGGTMALLTAESTYLFRAVFSFGPVEDVRGYGAEALPFDINDWQEARVRMPRRWLRSVHTPTYVFEGADVAGISNIASLEGLKASTQNPLLHFHPIPGKDHFSVLAPITPIIARKITEDTGPTEAITFSEDELQPK